MRDPLEPGGRRSRALHRTGASGHRSAAGPAGVPCRALSPARGNRVTTALEAAMAHIAGNPDALTARQRDLIDLAARLGRENFAPRAAKHDREASFPFENYDDLRRAGLLGLCVPEAHGGRGADFETYGLVS